MLYSADLSNDDIIPGSVCPSVINALEYSGIILHAHSGLERTALRHGPRMHVHMNVSEKSGFELL